MNGWAIRTLSAAAVAGCVLGAQAGAASETLLTNNFDRSRSKMIEAIVTEVRLTRSWIGKAMLDPRVLSVMAQVPRHEFVPRSLSSYAYLNRPVPVGYGQTVSQPYMVALMTDLAELRKGDDVLLLGIGGGYHAAVLAELTGSVSVVDMEPLVAESAMNTLLRLGYRGVELRNEDPYFGWSTPGRKFDAIIVRQATDYIPDALIRQLKPGGRIIAPIGSAAEEQNLIVGEKMPDGRLLERNILPVKFTRLPGGPRI